MGRKEEKTRAVGMANFGSFVAAWEVGAPYIEVYSPEATGHGYTKQQIKAATQRGERVSGSVHEINTSGDLNQEGRPLDGRTPDQYVRDELKRFVTDDGEAYGEAIQEGYAQAD